MTRFVDLQERLPENLQNIKIPWGPIGEQVYRRTYSQTKIDGRKESWLETVVRAVDGNIALVSPEFIEPGEREKLYSLLLTFNALPAGRHLNASGMKGRQFLFNCHSSGWDYENPSAHFTFLFDALMMGGGVGSNYSNRYMEKMPTVQNCIDLHIICRDDHPNIKEFEDVLSKVYQKPENFSETEWSSAEEQNIKVASNRLDGYEVIEVSDDREGWVWSIEEVVERSFRELPFRQPGTMYRLIIDVSRIRSRGKPLKTSGGIACGPGPLVTTIWDLTAHLNGCEGRRLTSNDAMVIDHTLSACVIAGGKRRSSRMAIKNWRDHDILEFIHCKRRDGAHWSTNISVEVDDAFFSAYAEGDEHAKHVMKEVILGKRRNGEPGIWNRSLSLQGEREPEEMYCPNPCGEIGLQMWENCFAGDERLITKEHGAVRFVDAVGQTVTIQAPQGWKAATISQFGEQSVQRVTFAPVRRNTGAEGYQKTRSNYRVDVVVTPNHRWEKMDGIVTDNLSIGDVVPMNAALFEKSESHRKGVQHGIMFGDGSADRQYADGEWRHRARLFGAKAEEMAKYFDHLTYPESANGAPEAWLKSDKNLKELPAGNEGSDYLSGFLAGWGMADANDRTNGSLHLGSTHPEAEAWLKQNAAASGWVLRSAKDSGTTETNLGKRKNPLMFFTLCRPDNENLAWQVVSVEELPEKVPVYCATVPGAERFTLASGISTCNCNLGHVNLGAMVRKPTKEVVEAFRLMTRWLIRATFGDVPSSRQRAVLDKNRRIGVGFFGYHEWLALNGIKYSDSWDNPWVIEKLTRFRNAVDTEASAYANQLGIPVPVKNTTLAPTGTIAILPGTTGSAQAMLSPWFKRLVRYSSMDPELAVKKLEGYEVFSDEDASNTEIVVYWCEDPLVAKARAAGFDPADILEGQYEVAFETSLKVQSMLQTVWANNAISFTINLSEDKMPTEEEMEKALFGELPKLKGTTVFPPVSRKNAPIQPITKAQFDAHTGRKETSMIEDECKGACPVK